jgi:hypothetical protein
LVFQRDSLGWFQSKTMLFGPGLIDTLESSGAGDKT